MSRILAVVVSLVILLLGAVLIGPSFIDWNKYKPQIVEQVKTASGYDVTIGGDIGLSVLPSPSLKIKNVSVAAPKRVKSETLASIEEAQVSVALFPLLEKRIEVNTVKLVKPDIRLEVLRDGSKGWMTDKLQAASDVTATAGQAAPVSAQQDKAMDAIAFDKVSIEKGRFEYADYQNDKIHLLEDINVALKADSLNGPYDGNGTFLYGGQKISFDGETSRAKDNEMTVSAEIGLPDAKAKGTFAGVIGMGDAMDVQGELNFTADRLGAVAAVAGAKLSPALDQKTSIKGIVTAGADSVAFTDMNFGFGDLSGKGTFALQNMSAKNPVKFSGDLDLKGALDLDKVTASAQGDKSSPAKTLANAGKEDKPAASAKPGFLPQSMTLPFQADGEIRLNIAEVKTGGKSIKGLLLDVKKEGGTTRFDAKAMEIPGNGKLDGNGTLLFASSSVSPQNGSVTYADPTLSFTAAGNAANLPDLMAAAGQKAPVADLFKTAQFNVSGAVTPARLTLKDSTVKLDQTTLAANLTYAPAGANGRADVGIGLSADNIDVDAIQARMSGKKAVPAAANNTAAAPNMKEAVKPLQDFSLPVNLSFDIAAAKARVNGMDVSNLRLAGKGAGKSLSLTTATADNFMGANVNARGQIADLEKLSGIDVDLQAKAADANGFLKALKVDTSQMPQNIGALDATISVKGAVDALDFTSNIKAMNGQLDATGNIVNALDKPSVSGLTLGVKHPNLVKAMQIVNPAFKGAPGLEKPFDFYTQMNSQGKVYNLTGMKANFGPTSVSGDVKADMSGAKASISGAIQMGNLPLDSFLGANTTASPSAAGVTTTTANSGGGGGNTGWSRNAIETGWMHNANMDLSISARSITYGGWNFENPTTKLNLKDGTLNVDNLNAGLFGGKATLNSRVVAPADQKQPVNLTVKTAMQNVQLQPLVYALSSSRKLQGQGTVSLDMDVGGAGVSPNALVSSLKGKANLNGDRLVIQGFDLAKLARGLATEEKLIDSAASLVSGALSGGSTQFDTVVGNYDITEGIVTISKMQMDGPSAVINSTGNVNLPGYTIDTKHAITLKNVENLEPFIITLAGPLNNPKTVGANILEEYARKKLERKIIKEVPKLLGDDVNQKLQQFGILPKSNNAPAPAPTPAPEAAQPAAGDGSWSDPAQQAAPAQEQPAQQQQPQPATPEEAIKGVLDGLLKQR